MHNVVVTDFAFKNVETERSLIVEAGGVLHEGNGTSSDGLLKLVRDADALLVQFVKIDAAMLDQLTRCRVIVR